MFQPTPIQPSNFGAITADQNLIESDFLRFQELLSSGAVSQQVFDSYQTKYQVAQSNYKQAETALAAAKKKLDKSIMKKKKIQLPMLTPWILLLTLLKVLE